MSTRFLMNRIHNSKNSFQGADKRVLCVCSAGLLRSPTAAKILSNPPFNYNTRAAGCAEDYALVVVDEVLLNWADEVVCMGVEHADSIKHKFNSQLTELHRHARAPQFIILDVEDNFRRDDPELIRQITDQYNKSIAVPVFDMPESSWATTQKETMRD